MYTKNETSRIKEEEKDLMKNNISKYLHCFALFLDSVKVKTAPSRQLQLQYCIQKPSGCKTKIEQNSFIKTTYIFLIRKRKWMQLSPVPGSINVLINFFLRNETRNHGPK